MLMISIIIIDEETGEWDSMLHTIGPHNFPMMTSFNAHAVGGGEERGGLSAIRSL